MSDYDNTNTGAMFANDKGDNDKRPDRKGSLNVDGVDYWISGWLRESKEGKKFLSLKVERKEAAKPSAAPPAKKDSAKAVGASRSSTFIISLTAIYMTS